MGLIKSPKDILAEMLMAKDSRLFLIVYEKSIF